MLSMPRIVRPNLLRTMQNRRLGSPVGSATHRPIKRNKELAEIFNQFTTSSRMKQLSQPPSNICNVEATLPSCFQRFHKVVNAIAGRDGERPAPKQNKTGLQSPHTRFRCQT
jgi:hypothetical protein